MTTMTTKPASARAYAGRTDARTDTDAANASKDTSLKTLLTELLGQIKAGEYVSGQKRQSVSGQVYIFRVQNAGALSLNERFKICLAWMKTHQVTNRAAFFAGCREASNNCQMHHRCINQLKREGLIEKIGREYVFKEEQP